MADLNAINLEITGTSESAQEAVKSTVAALEGLKALSAGLSSIKFSAESTKNITAISKAMSGIASASSALKSVGNNGFGGLNGFAATVSQLSEACKSITQGDIRRLQAVANIMNAVSASSLAPGNVSENIKNVTDGIGKSTSRAGKKINIGEIFTNAGKTITSFLKKSVEAFGKLGKAFKVGSLFAGDFVKSLARIAKYRVLRTILSSITKGATEGMQNLARSSEEARATLSQLSSGTLTLKNSMGGALYSVLASIVGVLSSIISAAVSAMNWISMLFSILGGRATFKKATSATKEYGAALGGAAGGAKALKQELMGFDEINSLTPDSGGGGGGGGGGGLDYGGMFEETPVDESLAEMVEKADFTLLGERIANKINTALSNINWSKIQTGAGKLAMSIATFINGAVFRLDANVVGSAIAGVVNTALEFVNTFTYKVNWGGLGDKIQQFISRAIKDVEPKRLGAALVAKVKIVLDFLDGLLPDSKSGWDEITMWFADVLKNAVDGVGRLPIARVIQSILEGALSAVTHISDAGVLSSLIDAVLTAITDALSNITAEDIEKALLAVLKETLHITGAVLKFVVNFAEVIIDWVFPKNFSQFAEDDKWFTEGKFGSEGIYSSKINSSETTTALGMAQERGIGISSNAEVLERAAQAAKEISENSAVAALDIENLFNTVGLGSDKEATLALTTLSELGVVAVDAQGNIVPVISKLQELGVAIEGVDGTIIAESLANVGETVGEISGAGSAAADTLETLNGTLAEVSNASLSDSVSEIDTSGLDAANSAASALSDTMSATGEDAEHLYTKIIEIPSDIVYNLELNNYDQIIADLDTLKSAITDSGTLGAFGFKVAVAGMVTYVTDNVVNPIKNSFNGIDLSGAGRKMMRSLKTGMRAIDLPKLKVTWSSSSANASIFGKNYSISIPKPNISFYAKGGFPSAGELFLANEAGAEMVGRIGNKPAVANQEQIGDAIFKYMDKHGGNGELDANVLAGAIVGALKSAGVGAVYLDGKMLSNSINREARRSGKPAINY